MATTYETTEETDINNTRVIELDCLELISKYIPSVDILFGKGVPRPQFYSYSITENKTRGKCRIGLVNVSNRFEFNDKIIMVDFAYWDPECGYTSEPFSKFKGHSIKISKNCLYVIDSSNTYVYKVPALPDEATV